MASFGQNALSAVTAWPDAAAIGIDGFNATKA
jgi:hypothetical protein